MDAYPSLITAWKACEDSITLFNDTRAQTLLRIRLLCSEAMTQNYPSLAARPDSDMTGPNCYAQARIESLVYLRIRVALGDSSANSGDPYVFGSGASQSLVWRGNPLLVSSDVADWDGPRLVECLRSAWSDSVAISGVRTLMEQYSAAELALRPLMYEASKLSDQLVGGHRILGTCANRF
jgi:hypothetical protein